MKNKIVKENLHQLLRETPTRRLDKRTKLVIFSDLHMGNGTVRDDFLKNSKLFLYVLKNYYLKRKYGLILNGDVEELQRFSFNRILRKWKEIYKVFKDFKKRSAFYKIIGNHDYELMYHKELNIQLLPAMKFQFDGNDLFIFHGHQGSRFHERYHYLSTFILRYIANPLGIKNYSPAYSSNKRYKVEKNVYEFSSQNKVVSIIGHTHRPLFESLSKIDSLKFKIEQLCRDYTVANKIDKKKMKIAIRRHKEELQHLYKKSTSVDYRSNIYGDLVIPCLFNSGCVIGKRGITAIEIADNKICLVHWFDKRRSKKYLNYYDTKPKSLGKSNYYRICIKQEHLNYVFTRINLLT